MRILDVFSPAILKEMLWRQNSPKCQHRPVHKKTISLTLIFMTHPALHNVRPFSCSLHLHLIIWQTFLSKATYKWGEQ